MVKDDPLDLEPSRGFPIRHLAIQEIRKLPPVILIIEHEGDFHQMEQVGLTQSSIGPVLESFIIFSIGKVFQAKTNLLGLLLSTISLMHGSNN